MKPIKSATSGVQYANGMVNPLTEDIQDLLGYRLSDKYIQNVRKRSPVSLFVNIDMDIDLCRPLAYAIEQKPCSTGFSDSVLGGSVKAQQWDNAPKFKTFHGYREIVKLTKVHKDALTCMEQSDVLMRSMLNDANNGIEEANTAIMNTFVNEILAGGYSPANTGNNAGLQWGGQKLGTPDQPLIFDEDNADKVIRQILGTIKQMPDYSMPMNEFGSSSDNMYWVGHTSMEEVLMGTPAYNSWANIGDCAGCNMFSDVFNKKPRNIMPIGTSCLPARICKTAGEDLTVYPIIFGRRYDGHQGAIRVETDTYQSEDRDWNYHRTKIKYNFHTYDCRNTGVAWVAVKGDKPDKILACG